jgi:hypothetical protein
VIAAFKSIWQQSGLGTTGLEASFNLNGNPSHFDIHFNATTGERQSQTITLQANTFAIAHVHPNTSTWQPSTANNNSRGLVNGDIEIANAKALQLYIVSREGLGYYNGTKRTPPLKVRNGLDWMNPCK